MPGLMKEMFVQDFLEARQAEKQIKDAIINNQITKTQAVNLLTTKIDYIRRDIASMDDNGWKRHKEKLVELDEKCKKNQNRFKADHEEPNDPIEEMNYSENLAYEKLKRLSAELNFIQRLGYDKGWLD